MSTMTMSPATPISRIAGILATIGIVSVPLDWIPIVGSGGILIEIPNAIALVFAMLLPVALFLSRRMWRINLFFGLLLLWCLIYLFAMVMHQTPSGLPIMRQAIMQCLFGWTLALCIAHSTVSLSRIGQWALIVLGVVVVFSASVVDVDPLEAVIDYLTTGNRNEFVYRAVRKIFNAYVPATDDIDYVASKINSLANGIVLFGLLVFIPDRTTERGLAAPEKILVFVFFAFAFILFSTSATLVMFSFVIALSLHVMSRGPMIARATFPLLAASVIIVVIGPILAFVGQNLVDDTMSHSSRLGQYDHALRLISENFLTGVGHFEVGIHPVHNWALFSWSTSGYILFLTVLAVYTALYLCGWRLAAKVRNSGMVVFALIALFTIRTSVGGAGGVPAGSAAAAAAVVVGLLERYHRLERQGSLLRAASAFPVPARDRHPGRPSIA